MMLGQVVSLDRGYPLVRTERGEERAQHAIDLVKNVAMRAAVGDFVTLSEEPGQDMLLITAIQDRASTLVRRELVESIHEGAGKTKEQILAANFDFVVIVQSLGKHPLDLNYLERQLVMAHESNREVLVVLTKADIARHLAEDCAAAQAVAPGSTVFVGQKERHKEGAGQSAGYVCHESTLVLPADPNHPLFSLPSLANRFSPDKLGVLLGRSGVGKSTLVNLLLGEDLLETGSVRQKDRAGRHVTVARRMVELPSGGAVIDTPGMRTIGILSAEQGLAKTFAEITAASTACRYRDCTHTHEPSCAVIAAVQAGSIPERRLDSYRALAAEVFD